MIIAVVSRSQVTPQVSILSCRSGIPLLLGKPKSPVLVYVALGVFLMLLSYLFIQARHNPAPAQPTAPLHDQK